MKYLVKRSYTYTTEEWVEADSWMEAKFSTPTDNEILNHEDTLNDVEIIESKAEVQL